MDSGFQGKVTELGLQLEPWDAVTSLVCCMTPNK